MCEQCLVNAEVVQENVLPGYTLMRARNHSETWPKGWFGLVQSNDPDFVFPGTLVADPLADVPDEQYEELYPQFEAQHEAHLVAVDHLKKVLSKLPAMVGYELIVACQRAGYSIEQHGSEVAFWLMNHLAKVCGNQVMPRILITPDPHAGMDAAELRDQLLRMGVQVMLVSAEDLRADFERRDGDLLTDDVRRLGHLATDLPRDALFALMARETLPMPVFWNPKDTPRVNQPWYQRHSQRNGKPPRF